MTAPSPDPSHRRRPPGRYDAPPLLGQRVLAVVVTTLLLAVLWAIGSFVWSRFGGEQVRGQVRTFEIVSDGEVSMELEVAKTAGARAYCVLRARGADGLEVGRDIAVLDAQGTRDEVVRGTFALATTRRAVTAELAGCTSEPISRETPAP